MHHAGLPGRVRGPRAGPGRPRGRGVIVIEGVPARVCAVCGDELLALRTVERLQALRRTPPPPTRCAPLYDFATAGVGKAEVAVP